VLETTLPRDAPVEITEPKGDDEAFRLVQQLWRANVAVDPFIIPSLKAYTMSARDSHAFARSSLMHAVRPSV
jgi:hypothetical protein